MARNKKEIPKDAAKAYIERFSGWDSYAEAVKDIAEDAANQKQQRLTEGGE